MKILNAFSLQMIAELPSVVEISELPLEVVKELTSLESFVGHKDTAELISSQVGKEVAFNRANLTLVKGESVVVAQYKGPRLQEGTKVLPEGAKFVYLSVTIH